MLSNIQQLEKQVQTLKESLRGKQEELTRAIRADEVAKDLRYYVYFCLVDGRIAYIGKGTSDRWKHTVSGSSSCRELNRDLFAGKRLTVFRTRDNLTEEEALDQEVEFIYSFGDCSALYNRTTPPECTRYSDWGQMVGEGDIEAYGTSDLAVMHRCFTFLGSWLND